MRANGVGVGMGCHQRCRRKSGNVAEAGLIHMRQVDQDAKLVAAFHKPLAGLCQAGADIWAGRIAEGHAMAEDGAAAPDRTNGAQPQIMQPVQHDEVRIDGLRAFEMHDGRDDPVIHCRPDISDRRADPQRAGCFQILQDRRLFQCHSFGGAAVEFGRQRQVVAGLFHRRAPRLGINLHRRHINGEETSGKTSGPGLFKIDRGVISLDESSCRVIGMHGVKA